MSEKYHKVSKKPWAFITCCSSRKLMVALARTSSHSALDSLPTHVAFVDPSPQDGCLIRFLTPPTPGNRQAAAPPCTERWCGFHHAVSPLPPWQRHLPSELVVLLPGLLSLTPWESLQQQIARWQVGLKMAFLPSPKPPDAALGLHNGSVDLCTVWGRKSSLG